MLYNEIHVKATDILVEKAIAETIYDGITVEANDISRRSLLRFIEEQECLCPKVVTLLPNGEFRCSWKKSDKTICLQFTATPYKMINFLLMKIEPNNTLTNFGSASAIDVIAVIKRTNYIDVIKAN